jgi:hypothetical protein
LPKDFRGHLTLNISNDGLVYAADRMANRIQVTTKQGKFMKEFILAPNTGEGGSTGGVMFSPDKEQRFLYISDITNNHIWFLNRADGKVLGQIGSMGQNGGQFFGLHMIAVDSKGNIYTGEVPTARECSGSSRFDKRQAPLKVLGLPAAKLGSFRRQHDGVAAEYFQEDTGAHGKVDTEKYQSVLPSRCATCRSVSDENQSSFPCVSGRTDGRDSPCRRLG